MAAAASQFCGRSSIQSFLRPVSIVAQRSTLRHAQQENNEVRDDRALSYLRAMGVKPLSTSRHSTLANESAIMETSL